MSNTIEQLSALAVLLSQADTRVTLLTDQLALAKAEKRRIEEEDLPDVMREIGMSEFKMEDGSAIKVTDEVDCAITEVMRPAAHAWLAANGFDGIIKSEVVITYDRDERSRAKEDAETIEKITGRTALLGEKVHPQTLKAFVKEQMTAGHPVPTELFGVRPYSKAKITLPKVSKKK